MPHDSQKQGVGDKGYTWKSLDLAGKDENCQKWKKKLATTNESTL